MKPPRWKLKPASAPRPIPFAMGIPSIAVSIIIGVIGALIYDHNPMVLGLMTLSAVCLVRLVNIAASFLHIYRRSRSTLAHTTKERNP